MLDRRGWVDANLASMRRCSSRSWRGSATGSPSSPFAPVGRHVAATEIGVLLGYLSKRVLGQYDLLVPDDPGGDAVYYVGPNILALEKRFAFRPRDFRLWIAIHEVTHRAQFTGVPWMREHFLSLVQQAFEARRPRSGVMLKAITQRARRRSARVATRSTTVGSCGLFASPEQRGVLGQVQALMSLLEGHGNVVMTELGQRHVAGEERMARRPAPARARPAASPRRCTSCSASSRRCGSTRSAERFIENGVAIAGFPTFDRVWRDPENLPTLAELDDRAGVDRPGRRDARVA